MYKSFGVALLLAGFGLCEEIQQPIALVEASEEIVQAVKDGIVTQEEVLKEADDQNSGTSEINVVYVPTPISKTNEEAEKPPGKWTDNQKLTVETFKEIVSTDTENVWVVAYIDPRCRDCLILSLEWEKLTQIETKEHRKVKLGYVDISVEENWQIIQDHTKGKKMTHTPAITLYGDNKETPHWYPENEGHPTAKGIHTWVSSYADTFGYGYWTPEQYKKNSQKYND